MWRSCIAKPTLVGHETILRGRVFPRGVSYHGNTRWVGFWLPGMITDLRGKTASPPRCR
jgi:hypothetical protein